MVEAVVVEVVVVPEVVVWLPGGVGSEVVVAAAMVALFFSGYAVRCEHSPCLSWGLHVD